jgi:hypothetical protein
MKQAEVPPPVGGSRRLLSASIARSEATTVRVCQPTIMREKTSMMNAT